MKTATREGETQVGVGSALLRVRREKRGMQRKRWAEAGGQQEKQEEQRKGRKIRSCGGRGWPKEGEGGRGTGRDEEMYSRLN